MCIVNTGMTRAITSNISINDFVFKGHQHIEHKHIMNKDKIQGDGTTLKGEE